MDEDNEDFQLCNCGYRGVWADMLILGCPDCGLEFYEEDKSEVVFIPEPSEE